MYRAYYHVDNPSDYLKISIYIVILDHLVGEVSKRVVSNKERFCFVFILSKPYKSSKLNL